MAVAARAGHVARFAERGPQSLARHLQQAESRYATDLHSCLVHAHGLAQARFDLALGILAHHVDEIDHHQPAEIPDAELSRDFVGRLEVGLQRGLLDIGTLGCAGRVDIDRQQRLGMVDHQGAAAGQPDFAGKRRLDLAFDLVTGEQRNGVAVDLELAQVVRHDLLHEFAGILEHFLVIDQNLADVLAQIVTQGADDQVAFLVDQKRRFASLGRFLDRAPELKQVVEIPLELIMVTADACGAHDHAHVVGNLDLLDGVEQFLAIVARDLAGDAAGTRVVGHQDQVASGQADEGRQRRPLGAAFFLVDLDDDFLATLNGVLDIDAFARVELLLGTLAEILSADFLERKKPVAFRAEFDKTGVETRLDAGDPALVDIGFFLFLGGHLDVEVQENLAIGDGDAQLFGLSRVDQHAFHCCRFLRRPGLGQARHGCRRNQHRSPARWTFAGVSKNLSIGQPPGG